MLVWLVNAKKVWDVLVGCCAKERYPSLLCYKASGSHLTLHLIEMVPSHEGHMKELKFEFFPIEQVSEVIKNSWLLFIQCSSNKNDTWQR